MTLVAPRIVNNVSYAMWINHESHFAWQVQHLVMLEDAICCSAHCKCRFIYVTRITHESHFAWQAQYLVMSEKHLCCSAHCK